MDINYMLNITLLFLVVLFIIKTLSRDKNNAKTDVENFKQGEKKCFIDNYHDELYNFATKKNCGDGDCDFCKLKFQDEQEIIAKLNIKHDNKCIVNKMENEVYDYMKKMIIL
jgi:hypothetical protein